MTPDGVSDARTRTAGIACAWCAGLLLALLGVAAIVGSCR